MLNVLQLRIMFYYINAKCIATSIFFYYFNDRFSDLILERNIKQWIIRFCYSLRNYTNNLITYETYKNIFPNVFYNILFHAIVGVMLRV